jgi:hypothetical protein
MTSGKIELQHAGLTPLQVAGMCVLLQFKKVLT